MSNKKNTI